MNRKQEKATDLLTPKEFGEIVMRTGKTVREWLKDGTLPRDSFKRINNRYYVYRWAKDHVID